MDKSENRMRCPFPRPIKKDPAEIEADSSWQAKESFGTKLRLVRISKQQRSTVSLGIRKMKRIPIAKPLPLPLSIQSMDKTHASEMKHLKELRATFQNNIDRINADWEKKLERKMAEMDKKLHSAKSKKWCPNCLKEVKFDTGFDPSACSIKCWKEILKSDEESMDTAESTWEALRNIPLAYVSNNPKNPP